MRKLPFCSDLDVRENACGAGIRSKRTFHLPYTTERFAMTTG